MVNGVREKFTNFCYQESTLGKTAEILLKGGALFAVVKRFHQYAGGMNTAIQYGLGAAVADRAISAKVESGRKHTAKAEAAGIEAQIADAAAKLLSKKPEGEEEGTPPLARTLARTLEQNLQALEQAALSKPAEDNGARVTELEGQITALREAATKATEGSTARVTELEGQLAAAQEAARTAETASTSKDARVTELEGQLAAATKKVENQKTQIKSLEAKRTAKKGQAT